MPNNESKGAHVEQKEAAINKAAAQNTSPISTTTTTKSARNDSISAHLINGIPHLPVGFQFAGKFELIERIGWDDRVGATYFALPLNASQQYAAELVLRVDKFAGDMSILRLEAAIIKAVENANKHQLFAQLHSSGLIDSFCWYTTFFRGGPTLKQITDFMRANRSTGARFSASTVGRFGENLFEIVEFLHSQCFLICALDQDMFHFDGASRTLFLADLSTCRVELSHEQSANVEWRGTFQYAPTRWSDAETLKRNAELEAVFYMIAEFALGELPWSQLSRDAGAEAMRVFAESKGIPDAIKALDIAYYKLWLLVKVCSTASQPYASVEPLLIQCKSIYERLGGCTSHDDDFDFERQPRDDEIPRFVLEKDEVDGAENGEQANVDENNNESANEMQMP